MEAFCRITVGGIRFLSRRVRSEINHLFVDLYPGNPTSGALAPSGSFHARSVIFLTPNIASVLLPGGVSKIAKSIVVMCPIDVVNGVLRPLASEDKPSNTVTLVNPPLQTDAHISSLAGAAGYLSPTVFPSQETSFWVIVQNATDVLRRKIVARSIAIWDCVVSHSTLLRSLWSGAAMALTRLVAPNGASYA
jgi:hypothetical protein